MTSLTPLRASRWKLFLCLAWLLQAMATPAHAGSIGFGLSLTENRLTVTNQGNSSAYYPTAFRLLGDGRWEQLTLTPGSKQPAELPPGAQLDFAWPENRPLSGLPPLEALRPVMVRFFDQAGASFGQMSFFNQPLTATDTLAAGYVDGKMRIAPPTGTAIRATWLLWPQEEGIAPLRKPVDFLPRQPPARHITWNQETKPQTFDLGAGLPVAFLLHETNQGLRLQVVADGGVQGSQQRTGWLDRSAAFQLWACGLAILGGLALLWQTTRIRRQERA